MINSNDKTRRRFLALCSGSATVALSGCSTANNEPLYQEGEVNQTGSEQRTAEQMIAAKTLAITEANENVSTLDSLTLENHEFTVKSGYKGPTVQGVVTNASSESVRLAEVRVRVYDANNAQLGRYIGRTGDIPPGTKWKFEVILLDSTSDIAGYDIAVLGIAD